MSKLGELSGKVEISIDGIDGVAVSTFEIPIAVMSQDRDGDKLTVAIGTPESTLRAGILAACREAIDLATGNIPTVRVEPAAGGVLPARVPPLPGPHLHPKAPHELATAVAAGRVRHR
ncbi:hypothetical protein ACYX8G_19215 [Microbacterium saperdae]